MPDTLKTSVDEPVFEGRYRVIRRLGTGGMATVYLAEDLVLGRQVAVKRMHSDSGTTNERRFRREARLGATLNHPNVVITFDTVAGEDGLLIVMEYVEGETLAAALECGPLEPTRALEVLRAVADALDHAHAQGVVHRDVKPANVLLAENGAVKLADLGIATAAEATQITSANDIVGTLPYIAPERLEGASDDGPATDVYGLSVLAYEALSGRCPHRGSSPAEVLQRTATAPPDLRDAWPGAPAEAAAVLQQGMSRDPAARPANCGELVDGLERALRGDDSEAATAVAPAPPTVREARARAAAPDVPPTAETDHDAPGRSPRALPALLALGLVALVAAAVAFSGGGDAGGPSGAQEQAQTESGAEAESGSEAEEGAQDDEAATDEQGTIGGPPTSADEAGLDPDPARGAELNDRGYQLIQQGRYDEAVPILERAVRSFPAGTSDLNHAYALFNLGNALRLAGRPAEAVPVLEERLEVPNQTGAVRRELELARAAANDG